MSPCYIRSDEHWGPAVWHNFQEKAFALESVCESFHIPCESICKAYFDIGLFLVNTNL